MRLVASLPLQSLVERTASSHMWTTCSARGELSKHRNNSSWYLMLMPEARAIADIQGMTHAVQSPEILQSLHDIAAIV